MVEAGMPPIDAILAATVVNAGILGIFDKVGTLEPGKFADIIATDENPLDDIHTLETVAFVMKEGKIYKRPCRPDCTFFRTFNPAAIALPSLLKIHRHPSIFVTSA